MISVYYGEEQASCFITYLWNCDYEKLPLWHWTPTCKIDGKRFNKMSFEIYITYIEWVTWVLFHTSGGWAGCCFIQAVGDLGAVSYIECHPHTSSEWPGCCFIQAVGDLGAVSHKWWVTWVLFHTSSGWPGCCFIHWVSWSPDRPVSRVLLYLYGCILIVYIYINLSVNWVLLCMPSKTKINLSIYL